MSGDDHLSIYDAQSAILRWLRDRGAWIEDGLVRDYGEHKRKSAWAKWKMCERKKRYENKPEESVTMRAYECHHCNGWHLATRWKRLP